MGQDKIAGILKQSKSVIELIIMGQDKGSIQQILATLHITSSWILWFFPMGTCHRKCNRSSRNQSADLYNCIITKHSQLNQIENKIVISHPSITVAVSRPGISQSRLEAISTNPEMDLL